jgi:hypothetical protein
MVWLKWVAKCCELEVQLCWTEGAENVGMIVEEVILGLKKRDLVEACHRICQLEVGISTKTYIFCD